MNKGRKITGGRYHAERKKRLHEKTVQQRVAVIGKRAFSVIRTRGGHLKRVLSKAAEVNLVAENGKVKKAAIKNVIETPQNLFFARQNRLMKGVLIETSLGKARITNRPSQEGHINAVLLKE